MRALGIPGRWFVILAACVLFGCGGTEAACEDMCEWADRCGGSEVSCSDANIDECVEELEKLSDDCQDAYEDFADCLSDLSGCDEEELQAECTAEALQVVEDCGADGGF